MKTYNISFKNNGEKLTEAKLVDILKKNNLNLPKDFFDFYLKFHNSDYPNKERVINNIEKGIVLDGICNLKTSLMLMENHLDIYEIRDFFPFGHGTGHVFFAVGLSDDNRGEIWMLLFGYEPLEKAFFKIADNIDDFVDNILK